MVQIRLWLRSPSDVFGLLRSLQAILHLQTQQTHSYRPWKCILGEGTSREAHHVTLWWVAVASHHTSSEAVVGDA